MKEIRTPEALADLINSSKDTDLFLFKHSTSCPVSAYAFEEFKAFAQKHPKVSTAFIDLLANRPASNALAEIAQVKHQSPQVIYYRKGKVHWNASHRDIDQQALEEQLKG